MNDFLKITKDSFMEGNEDFKRSALFDGIMAINQSVDEIKAQWISIF